MKKNMVYFVLYVVLITELLVVITERDELDAKDIEIRDKMLNTLVESYKQPLVLSVPQTRSELNLGTNGEIKIALLPAGLVVDEERKAAEYYVDISPNSRSVPAGWPKGGISTRNGNKNFKVYHENGNAVFLSNFSNPGEYKFVAYCKVERRFPSYLPEFLLNTLKEKVGENKIARSNTVDFVITAKAVQAGVKKKDSEMFF